MLCIALFMSMVLAAECIWKSNTYYKTEHKIVSTYYNQIEAPSRIRCASLCESDIKCNSASFKSSSKECLLSELALKDIPLNSHGNSEWTTFSKSGSQDWILMFQGVTGIGTDVYYAWVNGVNTTSHDVNCMTPDVTSCTSHYRNQYVDSWTNLPIREVKIAFVEAGNEVASMIYNGTGSDPTSWFQDQTFIESSWTNLNLRNESTLFFSAIGYPPSRRFAIVKNHGGCPVDTQIFLVLTSDYHICNYDVQPSYPRFVYSKSGDWSTLESTPADFGWATTMTISVTLY